MSAVVHVHVKAFWNRLMLIFALMLALPVGVEACSAPGTLDETDQPHALIGVDDDLLLLDVQASDLPTAFMSPAELPNSHAIVPEIPACISQLVAWNTAKVINGPRLHRWLCRELC